MNVRAYVVRAGDLLQSLDGDRRALVIGVIEDGDPWKDVRLRNPDTGREWYADGTDLWRRYRVLARGAEADIVRESETQP